MCAFISIITHFRFVIMWTFYNIKVCCAVLGHVWLFVTPCTVARQAPLSMGMLQARILEWVAMPSSRGSSQPRDWTQVSCIAGGFFTVWVTRAAHNIKVTPAFFAKFIFSRSYLVTFIGLFVLCWSCKLSLGFESMVAIVIDNFVDMC